MPQQVMRRAVRLQGWWQPTLLRARAKARLVARAIKDAARALPGAMRSGFYLLTGREEPLDTPRLRQKLLRFYDQFEKLVDVLCASAWTGATPGIAEDYRVMSERMCVDYPPLRRYLLAYLMVEVSDSRFGLGLCGRPTDAIESLFCAPDLQTLHRHDDGELMDRIRRSRDAMYRLGDHLRGKP